MKKTPLETGTIHFVGIGGIGMSGIAELLHRLGYKVSGSDLRENANVKRLQEMGILVHTPQTADNIKDQSVVVYSTAIKDDNPELKEARKLRIPVVRRAEMLAELMRLKSTVSIAGSHGKTTTTTMVASLLDQGKVDPTIVNGGIINAYGSNTRLGSGEWMVVEADESDGSFLKLPSDIAVITNADPEHLDHYGTYEKMVDAFVTFIGNLPFYGLAILCTDHTMVRQIAGKISDRRFITYGTNPQADIRALHIRTEPEGSYFDVEINLPQQKEKQILDNVFLPMPGEHNVMNALAAIAVAIEVEVSFSDIIQGLRHFSGVKRRFTQVGCYNDIRLIDDYAHHPIEITATLKAARTQVKDGHIMAVIQPHRYSRLNDLMDDFCGCTLYADSVYVSDIFAAGETPIENITAEKYVENIIGHGHKDAHYLSSFDTLPHIIKERLKKGDMVVLMGAGNITTIANDLEDNLKNA